ncbi:MAG: fumarylacetoacetate hydrolase family protein [Halomonas sp.]|uniref:fumarylacetoacetate hydrolase family protein n=1 Tax=Halomonas sp. AOP42-C1-46 TaxID=3457671 RepID=UPI003FB83C19
MKFLNFLVDGQPRLGVLTDEDRVMDLTLLLRSTPNHGLSYVPENVNDLLELGEEAVSCLRQLLAQSEQFSQSNIELCETNILPPVRVTKNIYCVGRNYRDHIIEGNIANGRPANKFPEAIEFFSKPPTTVVGHGANICRHAKLTNSLDYEVELAIVIGKRGVNIKRADALDHVFGYTIINDITARDLQKRHGQWLKGKSLDTTCPMGPVVVHHSVVDNPNQLNIGLAVNDEERQNESTSSMIFSIETIIEQLSAGLTLEPGDIIATGTPKGVGFAMSPPRCLEVGDVVSAWVEGIGTLTNKIVA